MPVKGQTDTAALINKLINSKETKMTTTHTFGENQQDTLVITTRTVNPGNGEVHFGGAKFNNIVVDQDLVVPQDGSPYAICFDRVINNFFYVRLNSDDVQGRPDFVIVETHGF